LELVVHLEVALGGADELRDDNRVRIRLNCFMVLFRWLVNCLR